MKGQAVVKNRRAARLAQMESELAALLAELEMLSVWAAAQEARQARLEALAMVADG